MSESVETAMANVLGHPTTCPHGNPIPGSDYHDPEASPLSRLAVGSSFTVRRIPEELEFTPGLLEYLEDSEIQPGKAGTITAISPDGTFTVEIGGRHVGVGAFASERILVTRAARAALATRARRLSDEQAARSVGGVLDVGRDPAGGDQLAVQGGQLGPRHTHVDVVGEVPAGVVRHHPEPGDPRLADHVRRAPAVAGSLHPAVLGDRPQAVGELPQRRPRADPHE